MAGALSSCGDAGIVQGAGGSAHVIRYSYRNHSVEQIVYLKVTIIHESFRPVSDVGKVIKKVTVSCIWIAACLGIRLPCMGVGKVLRQ